MAKIELVLPAMGEGIIEATIIKWLVSEGSAVKEDQPLIEIATDKVDSEIPSPVNGVLSKILANEGETPSVGDILAIIETEAGAEDTDQDAREKTETHEVSSSAGNKPAEDTGASSGISDTPRFQEVPRQTPSGKFLTPLVRNIAKKENISSLELDDIEGSGEGGRITKDDLLKYLEERPARKPSAKPPSDGGAAPEAGASQDAGAADNVRAKQSRDTGEPEAASAGRDRFAGNITEEGDRIIEMDRLRKLIADRMVRSKQISPHVTSFMDADVTGLVSWRKARKEEFRQRENQNLTLTPLFVDAAVKALFDYPMVNVSVDGSRIIIKKNINIGIAVALSDGNLIVPVIKNAGEKNLAGLARAVNDLAGRARINKLQAHEITGGTFTITNFGTFGNSTGTPIINQPEVAILGTGAISKKPVVRETSQGDVIAIRHMMTLSLSYDHRVVDGALGGTFLRRICEYLENFDTAIKI